VQSEIARSILSQLPADDASADQDEDELELAPPAPRAGVRPKPGARKRA
jgi:hypothetical protein